MSIHFWPDFVLSQIAKLLLIIRPSEKININPSIISIVLDYKLSIHFWPDLVLSQMAKLALITALSPINIVINSIIIIFYRYTSSLC